jgi:hypothetical protein
MQEYHEDIDDDDIDYKAMDKEFLFRILDCGDESLRDMQDWAEVHSSINDKSGIRGAEPVPFNSLAFAMTPMVSCATIATRSRTSLRAG